jgi:hypothetical protein
VSEPIPFLYKILYAASKLLVDEFLFARKRNGRRRYAEEQVSETTSFDAREAELPCPYCVLALANPCHGDDAGFHVADQL